MPTGKRYTDWMKLNQLLWSTGLSDLNDLKTEKFWEEHEVKVIYNAPATILFVDGEKYVSKAHDEKFDKEKGLLMCLAKAQGITHLDLKKMIDGAKVETKPIQPKKKKTQPKNKKEK